LCFLTQEKRKKHSFTLELIGNNGQKEMNQLNMQSEYNSKMENKDQLPGQYQLGKYSAEKLQTQSKLYRS